MPHVIALIQLPDYPGQEFRIVEEVSGERYAQGRKISGEETEEWVTLRPENISTYGPTLIAMNQQLVGTFAWAARMHNLMDDEHITT